MSRSTANLLGIEIGGTKLQVVLGDSQGNISQTLQVAADAAGGASSILIQLEQMAWQLMVSAHSEVRGVGIGFGGPVDSATGVVTKSNQVSGWENVALVKWAAEKLQLRAAVANDTDVATIAEARVGGGQRDRCVFYTNIGSGIGGGLVFESKLYSRPGGAMEIGQHRVFSKLAGRYGTLEEFCSGWALDRRAQQAAASGLATLLAEAAGAVNAETLFAAWRKGDESATQIVDDFLDCYGCALANIVGLLNPDLIIIGGGVAQTGLALLDAIRARVAEFVFKPFSSGYRIELTTLGQLAVPIGALLLAADLE